MALKINATIVATATPNVAWSIITSVTANLVQTVTINGTGTTTAYVNAVASSGSIVITRA